MILGDTPRMDEPIRQRLARLQGADQRIVMLGVPCFYYERVIVQSLKVSAGPDGNYVLTGGLQPSNQDRAETGIVRKDKPFSGYLRRQSRLMDADGPRQETFPGWDVQPFGGIRVLVNRIPVSARLHREHEAAPASAAVLQTDKWAATICAAAHRGRRCPTGYRLLTATACRWHPIEIQHPAGFHNGA